MISDTKRERELYKFYDPVPLIRTATFHDEQWVAKSSDDTALTAFAQLGALRLNARRGLIALFDRNFQYMVAEATQSLSLQSDSTHGVDDGLIWGQRIVPVEATPCHYVFKLPDKPRSALSDHATSDFSSDLLCINDLSLDDRFSDHLIVDTGVRWFAGVPIRSPRGINIGAYAILDDAPRGEPTAVQAKFMHDMASTVLNHLETLRLKSNFRRGERMLRGISNFVDGGSTLRTWGRRGSTQDAVSSPVEVEGRLNENQQSRYTEYQRQEDDNAADRASLAGEEWAEAVGLRPTLESSQDWSSVEATERKDPSVATAIDSQFLGESNQSGFGQKGHQSPEEQLSKTIERTFSRAANLLRESLQIEGCIFFDASVTSFGGLVSQRRGSSSNEYQTSTSSSGEDRTEDSQRSTRYKDHYCNVLGFSTSEMSSINCDEPPQEYRKLSQSALSSLLRTYRYGKIFNFDENGSASAGDSSEDDPLLTNLTGLSLPDSERSARSGRRSRRVADADSILKLFPGARTIAVIPLQGSNSIRPFAGAMVWTNELTRLLTPDIELSFLSAFGNSIMAEVSRLDTKFAEDTKSNLLSSISHELRSPLHGILGSVELLEESTRVGEVNIPNDVIHSIATCGRTLLDTVNHLLDFAKISNFMNGSKVNPRAERGQLPGTRKSANRSMQASTINLTSDVDLALIVEEVCDAVLAGYGLDAQYDDALNDPQKPQEVNISKDSFEENSSPNNPPQAQTPRPNVIIDITSSQELIFSTEAGAWTRIIMNLVGNALKYTDAGFIRIKLRAERHVSKRGTSNVVLEISDSGKGMSKMFLQHRLFAPFTQENSLSSGTGLGLSIVRNIVLAIGGKIDVRSIQGEGTTVTVTATLKRVSKSTQYGKAANTLTKDLGVKLVGFDNLPRNSVASQSSVRSSTNQSTSLQILERMCKDEFGMKIYYNEAQEYSTVPDMFIASEAAFVAYMQASLKKLEDRPPFQRQITTGPTIVICRSKTSALELSRNYISSRGSIITMISQPFGPRKFSKSIASVLNQLSITECNFQSNLTPAVLKAAADISSPTITEPSSSPSQSTRSSISAGRSAKALIVDDNTVNLLLLEAFMKKTKYSYATAINGQQAVDAFKSADPVFGIVLMDMSMPVMDGFEATRAIRKFERDSGLDPCIIIALTGLASESAEQEAYSSGIDLFLSKPVKFKDLMGILDQAQSGSKTKDSGQPGPSQTLDE